MKKYFWLSLLCMFMLSMVLTGCDPFFPPDETDKSISWTNPVKINGLDWVRDCYVFKAEGMWYMTGTRQVGVTSVNLTDNDPNNDQPSLEDAQKLWPGIFLWKSTDMVNWTIANGGEPILKNEQILWNKKGDLNYGMYNIWAPEIKKHPTNGKYYMTYSAGTFKDFDQNGKVIVTVRTDGSLTTKSNAGMAVADRPEGPWKNLTPDKAIISNNDASLFFDQDESGNISTYVWQTGWNYFKLDLETLENSGVDALGEIKRTSLRSQVQGAAGTWCDGSKINEGTHMIKIGKTYYLFWSCNAWGYFVGYATADNIMGPYTSNPNNPIWGAANAANQAKTPDCPLNEVGHGTPFIGPDGGWWISGHGMYWGEPELKPQLCFDKLNFNAEIGEFTGKFTWTPQTVKW